MKLIYIKPILVLLMIASLSSCKQNMHHGLPVLIASAPILNEEDSTFSFMAQADSVQDAKVTFLLYDGDSLIMQTADGRFTGVPPLDEDRYELVVCAEWPDTSLFSSPFLIPGFVIKHVIVPLSEQEIETMLNAKDKCLGEHLANGLEIVILNSEETASTFSEIIQNLDLGIWTSVKVQSVGHDETGHVTRIELIVDKGRIKDVMPIDDDEEEDEEYYY